MLKHPFVASTIATCLLFAVAGSATASGIAASVGINGFTYSPANVTIEAGQTVAFEATAFHPFTLDDAPGIVCTTDCNVHFPSVGEFGFYCDNHGSSGGAGMAGTVTVIASSITDRIFLAPFEWTMAQ